MSDILGNLSYSLNSITDFSITLMQLFAILCYLFAIIRLLRFTSMETTE